MDINPLTAVMTTCLLVTAVALRKGQIIKNCLRVFQKCATMRYNVAILLS